MNSRSCYYIILAVYCCLWGCQLIACQSTHSLIILTDSYINIYRILDTLLGIVHLKTQQQVRERKASNENEQTDRCRAGGRGTSASPMEPSPAVIGDGSSSTVQLSSPPTGQVHLFGARCTYQFRRLPSLGALINGLFLAALLMSAAIEGIQTCFHASHLPDDGRASILESHPHAYAALLIGLALVGVLMQWCSGRTHELRDLELAAAPAAPHLGPIKAPARELRVDKLAAEVPLTSLSGAYDEEPHQWGRPAADRWCWPAIRFWTSPVALGLCALTVLLADDEQHLLKEVVDAGLAITVVLLLIWASYPPLKRVAWVLLGVAPDQLDVDRVRADLLALSPLVLEVRELKLWSLAPDSGRVATCHLVIDEQAAADQQQVARLVRDSRRYFARRQIFCCAIQPLFERSSALTSVHLGTPTHQATKSAAPDTV